MAYREVGGEIHYPKYNQAQEGEILAEGKYHKSYEGNYGTEYEIIAENGQRIVLGSARALEKSMEYVTPGNNIKVVYNGTGTVKSGPMKGKSFHKFRVFEDKPAMQEVDPEEEPVEDITPDDLDI